MRETLFIKHLHFYWNTLFALAFLTILYKLFRSRFSFSLLLECASHSRTSHTKLRYFLIISDLLFAILAWWNAGNIAHPKAEKHKKILNKKFKLAKQIFSMSFHNHTVRSSFLHCILIECFEFDLISIWYSTSATFAHAHTPLMGPTF